MNITEIYKEGLINGIGNQLVKKIGISVQRMGNYYGLYGKTGNLLIKEDFEETFNIRFYELLKTLKQQKMEIRQSDVWGLLFVKCEDAEDLANSLIIVMANNIYEDFMKGDFSYYDGK